MGAHLVVVGQEPIVVTNTKGVLVQTRPLPDGHARFGFFECPLSKEAHLLTALYNWVISSGGKSPITSVGEAIKAFPKSRSLVLADSLVAEVLGPQYPPEQIAALMQTQGYLAIVEGRQVLTGGLPPGTALLLADAQTLGVYTRVGEFMGLQLYNVVQNALPIRVP